LVSIALFRFPSRDVIETTFADDRKRDEDVAAGRNHSGEPGTITEAPGVGDAAYVQMETPPSGARQPNDYTLRARAGTLLIKVHVQDYGTLFGPNSGNAQQAIDLGKLLITKTG
jgi:hypothetical protein